MTPVLGWRGWCGCIRRRDQPGEIADFYLDGAETVFARLEAKAGLLPQRRSRAWAGHGSELKEGVAALGGRRSQETNTETLTPTPETDAETETDADAESEQKNRPSCARRPRFGVSASRPPAPAETRRARGRPNKSTRLWHLFRWADEPTPDTKGRNRIAELSDVCAAFAAHAANENDVYDQILTGRDKQYYHFNDLQSLSGRKNTPLLDKTPGLREIVDKCRKRIIEIELRRGDTETAASKPALVLRWSGGMDTLLALVSGLGKDSLARGYSYYGQSNRANVFSHLIRATFPGETDTPDAFVQAFKAAKISEKRLLEIAVYAPQWARHAENRAGLARLGAGDLVASRPHERQRMERGSRSQRGMDSRNCR